MIKKQTERISARDVAKKYASIYEQEDREVARLAFLDGMVFLDMCKAGAITADMINEDFLAILSDSNHSIQL